MIFLLKKDIKHSHSFVVASLFNKGIKDTRFRATEITTCFDGTMMHIKDTEDSETKYEVHIRVVNTKENT